MMFGFLGGRCRGEYASRLRLANQMARPKPHEEHFGDHGLSLFANPDSIRRYYQQVDTDDSERFSDFIESKSDDPKVSSWLATLTPSQRSELGL